MEDSNLNKQYLDKFESRVHNSLARFLVGCDAIDARLPETHDIEERWEGICMAYLPDGVREFAAYPTVSLGWMMFIGMALAKMWDEDWQMYSQFTNIYESILKKGRGYDCMDEYICQDLLKLSKKNEEATSKLVADAATMVHGMLIHEGFEPGTPTAFNAYVRCLHQLYYFGAAIELKRLGYHMVEC